MKKIKRTLPSDQLFLFRFTRPYRDTCLLEEIICGRETDHNHPDSHHFNPEFNAAHTRGIKEDYLPRYCDDGKEYNNLHMNCVFVEVRLDCIQQLDTD